MKARRYMAEPAQKPEFPALFTALSSSLQEWRHVRLSPGEGPLGADHPPGLSEETAGRDFLGRACE